MSDNTYFRTEPVWGAAPNSPFQTSGPGPGMQAPENRQHAPQPGEADELLPDFEGSEQDVRDANVKYRKDNKIPTVHRMAPYLQVSGTVFFNATSDNTVVLGRPNKGFRWTIRQFSIVPGSSLTDTSFVTGSNFLAAFFIGSPPLSHPGGALTQVATLGDVAALYEKPNNATVPGTGFIGYTKEYGPNQLQVLENQALYAQVLASGSASTTPVFFSARYEQFPVDSAKNVEEV